MKKARQILSVILTVALIVTMFSVLGGCSSSVGGDSPKRIVGYAPWWRKAEILKTDFTKLTHVNLSFIRWVDEGSDRQPDGKLEFDFGEGVGTDAGFSDSDIKAIVAAVHDAGAKILLSFGGSGGHDINSMPINDETHRQYIANVLFEVVDTYGFDGVDMDFETNYSQYWEYYDEFTSILRAGCDARGIELTMAVSPWFTSCIENEGAVLDKYDFINVMSYDNQYNQDGTAAGIALCDHSPIWQAYQLLDYYTGLGIAADKITIGDPFYAYNQGSTIPGVNNWGAANGWANIYAGNSNLVIDRLEGESDADAMRRVTQTKAYIGATEAGGICIWELGQDVDSSIDGVENSLLNLCYETMYGTPATKTVLPIDAQKEFVPATAEEVIETSYEPLTRASASPDFPSSDSRTAISPAIWLDAEKNQTLQLTADTDVTWSVRAVEGASPAKNRIVSVDENGLVTALGVGSAVIDAYNGDIRVGSVLVDVPETVKGAKPRITTGSLPSGNCNNAYTSTSVSGTGSPSFSWEISGLPKGMNAVGARIFGTPTEEGTFKVTVKLTNAYGTAEKTFNLKIDAPIPATAAPEILTTTIEGGTVDSSYNETLDFTGDRITWSVSGNLPAGLSLNDNVISGTPSQSGDFTFTVTAANDWNGGTSVSKEYSVTIAPNATPAIPTIKETVADTEAFYSILGGTNIWYFDAVNGYAVWYANSTVNNHPVNLPDNASAAGSYDFKFATPDYEKGKSYAKGDYVFYSAFEGKSGIIYTALEDTSAVPGTEGDTTWQVVYEPAVKVMDHYIPKYTEGATVSTLKADPMFAGEYVIDGTMGNAGFEDAKGNYHVNPEAYAAGSIVSYKDKYYEAYDWTSAWDGWQPGTHTRWHEITIIG